MPSNNTAWENDFMFVGRAIAARLTDQVSALRESIMVDDLEPSATKTRQTPAALTMLHYMDPDGGGNGYSDVSVVKQGWLVFLVDRTLRTALDRAAESVGPVVPQIIRALHGYTVPGTTRPLAWVKGGPAPKYYPDGTVMYPMLFAVQFSV